MKEFEEGKKAVEAWVSFTCRETDKVDNGDSFEACVEVLNGSRNVVGVGVNCVEPHLVPELLRTTRRATSGFEKMLVCYPNSGEISAIYMTPLSTWSL